MFRCLGGPRRLSLALAFFILIFASAAAAQQFQIVRAEYGYGDRWVDVTSRLRDLTRTDRPFRVGNDAFGVDPAPGRRKMLRIDAHGPRGDTRAFTYSEGSTVEGSQFSDRWGDHSDRGAQDVSGALYQIVRAEYGFAYGQVDVTLRLHDLMRGNRSFRVGNDAFGVDPAPGLSKMLRIDARGPRGETRTFEYAEGSLVNGSQFSDGNGGSWNGGDRDNVGQLNIISAVYGATNRHINVAARLESLVRENRLNLTVSNSTLDIDPAPGTHKTLSVTYAVGGGPERQVVVGEGNQLTIP